MVLKAFSRASVFLCTSVSQQAQRKSDLKYKKTLSNVLFAKLAPLLDTSSFLWLYHLCQKITLIIHMVYVQNMSLLFAT